MVKGNIDPAMPSMKVSPIICRSTAAALALSVALTALHQSVYAQPTQPIYLQYDGWVHNADGSYTLSFGYFNMNNVDVRVPPGEANGFAPGPADRNQQVTFVKGRHRFACSMVVDRTFDGKLQWTVKFAGKTSTTTAKVLDPLYELEHSSHEHATSGLDVANAPKNVCVNRPPSIHVGNPFAPPPGPDGVIAGKPNQDVTLTSQIEDDGLPRNGALTIAWKKISGPGDVTFAAPASATTRAKFSGAGRYELELSATDGERTTTVKVNVQIT
jgi:hypothetical protein